MLILGEYATQASAPAAPRKTIFSYLLFLYRANFVC